MSANLQDLFAQQFATNVELLLQQKGSRLRGKVMEGTQFGEQASPVDQIGAIEMQPVVGRFTPKGRVDAPTDRRWVFPDDFDLNQLIDKFDKLKLLADPTSVYVMNAVHAAGRRFDKNIINAFFEDAKVGKSGSITKSFLAANVVAVGFGAAGNVGLTVPKLREAKRILMSNDLDMDEETIFFGVTAKQHDDLLAEVQIISTDFNDRPVLVDGKIKQFLGMTPVHTELFNVDGSGFRRIPVWAKSGMHLGIWEDMTVDVDQRKDLSSHPWQAYLKLSLGATRLEEEKTIEIKCAE